MLLALGKEKAGAKVHQRQNEQRIMRLLGHGPGARLGVWPEVKVKHSETVEGVPKTFDYTFDYVVMAVGRLSARDLEAATGEPWSRLRRTVQAAGYSLARRSGEDLVDNAPLGVPGIIEIMTSSTSGGNRSRRTTIPMAFEDALLRDVHTRLDVHRFLAEDTDEVNVLSFSYGGGFEDQRGVIELGDEKLYAGPISEFDATDGELQGFQDIIRAPISPPRRSLMRALATRAPVNQIVVEDAVF
jgi:hypothetical protein